MGCIKSKENKSLVIKYRFENILEFVSISVSYYGVEFIIVLLCLLFLVKGIVVNFSSFFMILFGGFLGVIFFGGVFFLFLVVLSLYFVGLIGGVIIFVVLYDYEVRIIEDFLFKKGERF